MATAFETPQALDRSPTLRGMRILFASSDLLTVAALRHAIEQRPDLCIVGEATHWTAIAHYVEEFLPEIVFCGCDVLPLALERFPTPFPLLVSIGDSRLTTSSRVVAVLPCQPSPQEIVDAVDSARIAVLESKWQDVMQMLQASRSEVGAHKYTDTLEVSCKDGVTTLPIDEIRCITAAKNYVRMETTSGEFQARAPISEISARLDPSQFVRIHRSVIVSKNEITSVIRREGNCVGVVLRNGKRFPIGSTYRQLAVQAFGDAC